MADAVDNDTMEAIRTLWQSDAVLPTLFRTPIQAGRLRPLATDTPKAFPYAHLDVKFSRRALTGTSGSFHDYRTATITLYGIKEQIVNGLKAVMGAFNLGTTLAYPSRARFMRWYPLDGGGMEEDDTTREGQDVWKAVVQAEVWSIRER